jgi:mRNA deadenylase 3'-5' endonuclease subunit Ccr4
LVFNANTHYKYLNLPVEVRKTIELRKTAKMKINLCCWNVLADVYAHGQLTPNKPLELLEWSKRFDEIRRKVELTKANIFCLQEVDHFAESYEPFFSGIMITLKITINID